MEFDPESAPRPMYPGFGDDAPSAPATAAQQQPAPMPIAPVMAPMQQQLPAPAPAVDPKASRRAGTAILLAGIGVGTGALLGGAWGAGSGLFLAGALSNAYRANSLWRSDYADVRKEAVKTTVMTVLGLGLAGYLGYRAHESKHKD
jgi:hypothetical protein